MPAAEPPDPAVLLVLVTAPDAATGAALARAVVEQGLAACVNRVPGVRSLFRWEGRVEEAEEELLVLKTGRARYAALERTLRDAHPYECPEILAVAVDRGLEAYCQWVHDQTA